MDQEKKQKVMIGVIVVAILGAGTVYWVSSGSGNRNTAAVSSGPVVRATRANTGQDTSKTPKRAERAKSAQRKKATTERAVRRERAPTTEQRRKTRGRTEQRKQKKKELPPMG